MMRALEVAIIVLFAIAIAIAKFPILPKKFDEVPAYTFIAAMALLLLRLSILAFGD